MRQYVSKRQRDLFEAIAEEGPLIFAAGPTGISANYTGVYRVRSDTLEDRLEADDGTFHVHLDWSRIKRVTVDLLTIEGRVEGTLTFWDQEENLFRLYRPSGPFSARVAALSGDLV